MAIASVGAPTTGGATATSTGAATDAGYTTEQVTISCPSGASNSIPISYKTQQCRSAMIAYAEIYACNRIDDFARAAQTCSSACGNAQCRE